LTFCDIAVKNLNRFAEIFKGNQLAMIYIKHATVLLLCRVLRCTVLSVQFQTPLNDEVLLPQGSVAA